MVAKIVHYKHGAPIDTTKPLEISGLPPSKWGPVEQAYPEIALTDRNAKFRRLANTTIFPPEYVSARGLARIVAMTEAAGEYIVKRDGKRIVAVLFVVYAGYASVHIKRLRA